jgi:hypothetical protein
MDTNQSPCNNECTNAIQALVILPIETTDLACDIAYIDAVQTLL